MAESSRSTFTKRLARQEKKAEKARRKAEQKQLGNSENRVTET